ncbi:MAG: DUF4198 domain-containing protein [Myxococcota bacterium]
MRSSFVVLLCLLASPAWAHDFWIEPSAFSTDGPSSIDVRLKVGHHDDVKAVARKPDRILRFETVGPDGSRQPVLGEAEAEPAGRVQLMAPGFHSLVFESNHAYIELSADKFANYLEHEGLTQILALRDGSDGPGKESYARYCKSLVQIGEGSAGWERDLELPFEFIALRRPESRKLVFRLEFQDQPLADARVELLRLEDLTQSVSTQTNAKGVLRFKNLEAGRYMLAATHMVPAKAPVKGDWESFWATVSFERRISSDVKPSEAHQNEKVSRTWGRMMSTPPEVNHRL